MLRSLILVSFVALIGLTSCEKTITKTACFTLSKNTIKMGDTVFLFNCSEGYQSSVWYLPNGTIDSNRHSYFTPIFTGPNPILLRIGNYAFTDTVGTVKFLTVEP
jgi:hypothetical protein